VLVVAGGSFLSPLGRKHPRANPPHAARLTAIASDSHKPAVPVRSIRTRPAESSSRGLLRQSRWHPSCSRQPRRELILAWIHAKRSHRRAASVSPTPSPSSTSERWMLIPGPCSAWNRLQALWTVPRQRCRCQPARHACRGKSQCLVQPPCSRICTYPMRRAQRGPRLSLERLLLSDLFPDAPCWPQ
jgi:hypothetical protein